MGMERLAKTLDNMEQFILALPNTFIGWISSILVVIGGVVLLFNRIRNEDLRTLREANSDLRLTLSDNTKKMTELDEALKMLTEKVLILENEKKTIQDLVILALEAYFENNPSEALRVKTKVKTEVTSAVG
jgi:plasmid maintenance system antidote protein VapI